MSDVTVFGFQRSTYVNVVRRPARDEASGANADAPSDQRSFAPTRHART